MPTKIVIIGAGVSGLTTAVELKRKSPDYDITIVAKDLPGELKPPSTYTSPFAGANWHSFASNTDFRLQEFDKIGYKRLAELATKEPKSGIWLVESHLYKSEYTWNKIGRKFSVPWYADFVGGFEQIPPEKLPKDAAFGLKFNGLTISVPVYLGYLLNLALEQGVVVRRVSAIKNIQDARELHSSGSRADLVINCTGVLANRIEGYSDPSKNYPVLGQVLHIRNSAPHQFSLSSLNESEEEESLYIFPKKEGGCTVGGCRKTKFDSTEEDKELTKRLIDKAAKYLPILVNPSYKSNSPFIDVVGVGVGLRPFREAGVRVERDKDHDWLIHNYGAGPGGYQGSFGFAEKVVEIVSNTKVLAKF